MLGADSLLSKGYPHGVEASRQQTLSVTVPSEVVLLTVHTVFTTPPESYATAAVEVGNRGSERHCETLLIPFYEGLHLSITQCFSTY